MLYSRAVEIVQDEEYLDESDFDEIRLRYKRNIKVNNHNELMTSKQRIRSKRQSEVVTNGKKTFYFVNPLTRGYPLGWGLHCGGYPLGPILLGLPPSGVTLWAYVNCKKLIVIGECPSGWLNAGELGGCYLFSPNGPGLNFYEAKDFCVSVGGFLTDILNQETQDFIDNSGFRQSNPTISWWIGGCDNAIVSFVSNVPFIRSAGK